MISTGKILQRTRRARAHSEIFFTQASSQLCCGRLDIYTRQKHDCTKQCPGQPRTSGTTISFVFDYILLVLLFVSLFHSCFLATGWQKRWPMESVLYHNNITSTRSGWKGRKKQLSSNGMACMGWAGLVRTLSFFFHNAVMRRLGRE